MQQLHRSRHCQFGLDRGLHVLRIVQQFRRDLHHDQRHGTCSVIANQAGNSSYAAAPQVTDTVTATPLGQTITFTIQAPASAATAATSP